MTLKQCTKCFEWKEENINFYFLKPQKRFITRCNDCKKKYLKLNEDKIKIYKANYRRKNKEILKKKNKRYILDNPKKRKETIKKYYEKKLKSYNVVYNALNKDKIKVRKNNYEKRRREQDPAYKLRANISRFVRRTFHQTNSNKNNASFLSYVSWTPEQLKLHIEALWEPWMSWENYGNSSGNSRKWNIDHIIPQSALPYNSMKDNNFKLCWDLKNLRPLESIQNSKKGAKII